MNTGWLVDRESGRHTKWWTRWGALPPTHQLMMHCHPIDLQMTYLLNMWKNIGTDNQKTRICVARKTTYYVTVNFLTYHCFLCCTCMLLTTGKQEVLQSADYLYLFHCSCHRYHSWLSFANFIIGRYSDIVTYVYRINQKYILPLT